MKIKDLRDCLVHAYNNREEIQAKGEAARKKVLDQFTWKHVAEKFMRILEENL